MSLLHGEMVFSRGRKLTSLREIKDLADSFTFYQGYVMGSKTHGRNKDAIYRMNKVIKPNLELLSSYFEDLVISLGNPNDPSIEIIRDFIKWFPTSL